MPADRLEWFPFSPADFLLRKGVACLDAREMGVYVRLMCHAWMHGPLPKPMRSLAVLAGLSAAEMAECWPALEPCFTEAEDGYALDWLEEVRVAQGERAQKGREKASAAIRKRWDRVREGYSENTTSIPVVYPENTEVRSKSKEELLTTPPLSPPGGGNESDEEKPKRKTPACRLPDPFEPAPDCRAVAAEEGKDHDRELVRFKDHALQNDRTCAGVVGWNAAFRNWLRSRHGRVRSTQLHGRGNGTSVHSPEPELEIFMMPPKESA